MESVYKYNGSKSSEYVPCDCLVKNIFTEQPSWKLLRSIFWGELRKIEKKVENCVKKVDLVKTGKKHLENADSYFEYEVYMFAEMTFFSIGLIIKDSRLSRTRETSFLVIILLRVRVVSLIVSYYSN